MKAITNKKKGIALLYTVISMMIVMALITVMLALSTMTVSTANKSEIDFERRMQLDSIAEQFLSGDMTTNEQVGVYKCRVYNAENKLIVLKGDVTLLTVIYETVGGEKNVTCYVYGAVE